MAGSRLARADRAGRINEDPIPRGGSTPGSVDVVPGGDRVPSIPIIHRPIEDSCGALSPVQKTALHAWIDGGIVDHPFGSASVSYPAARIPQKSPGGEGKSGPLPPRRDHNPPIDYSI